ncbi:MAG: DUF1641 domain-containing protein [Deltaproteobacteria bacterium]|nr:DUF1641 domain-containing protein [Deltaproteobacteria bacterium]
MSTDDQILERLVRLEEKLDRLTAGQEQLSPFIRSYDNLTDLGRDLSLLMGPTVNLMTEELAEVETGFQLEDSFRLLKQLLLNMKNLAWSLEQLENAIDWWHDLEPLLKIAVPHVIDKLDDLEQKGIFRINAAILNMYTKLASAYTPEDVEVIGDGFVRMHGMVKKFSDPRVIDFLDRLSDVPAQVNLDEARPVGPFGMMFRMMGKETKQGLGVALELTKALGKVKSGNGHGQPVDEGN